MITLDELVHEAREYFQAHETVDPIEQSEDLPGRPAVHDLEHLRWWLHGRLGGVSDAELLGIYGVIVTAHPEVQPPKGSVFHAQVHELELSSTWHEFHINVICARIIERLMNDPAFVDMAKARLMRAADLEENPIDRVYWERLAEQLVAIPPRMPVVPA